MKILLFSLGGLVALAVLVVLFLTWFTRRAQRVLDEKISRIRITEIPLLAEECIQKFATSVNQPISFENWRGSAEVVEKAIKMNGIYQNFDRSYFNSHVIYLGAFLGELMRKRTGGEWRAEADGTPYLYFKRGEAEVTTYPFHKIYKQQMSGAPGDLCAFLELAFSASLPDVK